MSKFLSILLILISQISFLTPAVFAQTPSCRDFGITPSFQFIPENEANPKLTFRLRNDLIGKPFTELGFVHFVQIGNWSLFGRGQTFKSGISGKIDNSFTLDLTTDSNLTSAGVHSGDLWSSDPTAANGSLLCTSVSYQIGATGGECFVDKEYYRTHSLIPGGQGKINIKFIGKANTLYRLTYYGSERGVANPITTGADGQGSFNDVLLPGNEGEIIKLRIVQGTTLQNGNTIQKCYLDIKLSSKGSLSIPGPSDPTTPEPEGDNIRVCAPGDQDCTTSIGQEIVGCTDDSNNPGVSTAIGCVHTSPLAFVKDFLGFITAFAGGIAFLMMLAGAFQMVTSAGNPDILNTGRERFTNAVIGLLLVIFAILLMQIIGFGILRIPGFLE